ncbi:hypothetical protein M440DRAFT_134856 [Trichoderma longibrachiatum ATCC 18648]|uniref:Uncharacterized protein n=1 Tax=Trichoderma longibrachiatum ATCC 18648 TaxID=983965 RepID=A0A2T4BWH2_TRILO|nr:hypothetical protein M440DRAFT_134856 [Trichoderma longibrachiatum ATCC 18648]
MIHITACCVRRMCLLSTRRDVDLLLFLKCDIVYLFLFLLIQMSILSSCTFCRLRSIVSCSFFSCWFSRFLPDGGRFYLPLYNNRGGRNAWTFFSHLCLVSLSSFPLALPSFPCWGKTASGVAFENRIIMPKGFIVFLVSLALWTSWSPLFCLKTVSSFLHGLAYSTILLNDER